MSGLTDSTDGDLGGGMSRLDPTFIIAATAARDGDTILLALCDVGGGTASTLASYSSTTAGGGACLGVLSTSSRGGDSKETGVLEGDLVGPRRLLSVVLYSSLVVVAVSTSSSSSSGVGAMSTRRCTASALEVRGCCLSSTSDTKLIDAYISIGESINEWCVASPPPAPSPQSTPPSILLI